MEVGVIKCSVQDLAREIDNWIKEHINNEIVWFTLSTCMIGKYHVATVVILFNT